jgi:hypothetical protein
MSVVNQRNCSLMFKTKFSLAHLLVVPFPPRRGNDYAAITQCLSPRVACGAFCSCVTYHRVTPLSFFRKLHEDFCGTYGYASVGVRMCLCMYVPGVRTKGIQNKKCISRKVSYTYPIYVIGKENPVSFFFPHSAYAHAPPYLWHHVRNHLDRVMTGR